MKACGTTSTVKEFSCKIKHMIMILLPKGKTSIFSVFHDHFLLMWNVRYVDVVVNQMFFSSFDILENFLLSMHLLFFFCVKLTKKLYE